MNWEIFKSLLLTILVTLGCLLTWNLWNHRSNDQTLKNTSYVNSAIKSVNGKRSISEVVHPIQVVFHQPNKTVGTVSVDSIKNMFNAVMQAEYRKVTVFDGKKSSPKQNIGRHRIEMIFPHSILGALFGQMLQKNNSQQQNERSEFMVSGAQTSFDRIIFYNVKKDPSVLKALFESGDTVVASAELKGLTLDVLEQFANQDTIPYLSKKLDHAKKRMYLPKNKVKMNDVYYVYKWIDVAKFKTALFSDPHDVIEQKDRFTNAINLLKYHQHVMKYINPDPNPNPKEPDAVDTEDKTVVRKGLDYVNGHSGWTDSYIYFHDNVKRRPDGDPVRGDVTFRLMINNDGKGYPVFSSLSGYYPYLDAATILLKWKSGEIHEYARTLMDLQSLSDKEATIELPSGADIWTKLKNSVLVEMDKVQNLMIGYHMDYPPAQNAVLFTPKWFVLYGDSGSASWQPIESLLQLKETEDSKGGGPQ